jgi:hypothetical protein
MSTRLYTENDLKLDKNADKIRCSICLDIVYIATGSDNCPHIFCKECINEVYKKSRECPECKKVLLIQANKYYDQNNIYNLTYECPNNNCTEKFLIGDNCRNIVAHKKVCPSALINCTYCKSKIMRKDMKHHQASLNCKEQYLNILKKENNDIKKENTELKKEKDELVQTENKYNNLKRKIDTIQTNIDRSKYMKLGDEYYRREILALQTMNDFSWSSDDDSEASDSD